MRQIQARTLKQGDHALSGLERVEVVQVKHNYSTDGTLLSVSVWVKREGNAVRFQTILPPQLKVTLTD